MKTNFRQKGFTLIEILIVIAIIGLLASIVLVNLGGFRAKGRDARRIADLRTLQNTLELYFSSNGSYPDTLDLLKTMPGVGKLPTDPGSSLVPPQTNYVYCLDAAKGSYIVGAALEGDNVALKDSQHDVAGYTCQVPAPAGFNCAYTAKTGPFQYCIKF